MLITSRRLRVKHLLLRSLFLSAPHPQRRLISKVWPLFPTDKTLNLHKFLLATWLQNSMKNLLFSLSLPFPISLHPTPFHSISLSFQDADLSLKSFLVKMSCKISPKTLHPCILCTSNRNLLVKEAGEQHWQIIIKGLFTNK